MSCASIRVSVEWPPEEASEPTDTLVLTSPEGNFVDLRRLKETGEMDWVMTGKERVLQKADPLKLEFQHEINSHVLPLKRGFDANTRKFDTGEFYKIEGSTNRLEIGRMYNADTGKEQDYKEVWRTIDPEDVSNGFVYKERDQECEVLVKKVVCGHDHDHDHDQYLGTIVQLGCLLQGALLDKRSNEVSCVRMVRLDGVWKEEFSTGEFRKGNLAGVQWEVVECSGN